MRVILAGVRIAGSPLFQGLGSRHGPVSKTGVSLALHEGVDASVSSAGAAWTPLAWVIPSSVRPPEIQVSGRFVPVEKPAAWIRPTEYMTFAEDDERRDADDRQVPDTIDVLEGMGGDFSGRLTSRGVLGAVNPSRTARPTSSRLLASSSRRKFRSQVVRCPSRRSIAGVVQPPAGGIRSG